MCTFERDRAYEYCRTCFIKFEHKSLKSKQNNSININKHEPIKNLIELFIDVQPTDEIKGFPKHICINCYNKLQSFDDFCKQAQEKARHLYELFANTELSKNSDFKEKKLQKEESLDEEDFWGPLNNVCDFNDSSSNLSDLDNKSEIVKSEQNEFINEDAKLSDKELNLDTENSKNTTFKCKHCAESLESISLLDKHMREKHLDTRRPFRCDECDKCFSVEINLTRHKKDNHEMKKPKKSQQNPEEYHCKECNLSFTTKRNFNRHMTRKIHASQKETAEFECKECNRMFPSQYSLTKHMSYKHPLNPSGPFVCEHCGITYPIWASLKMHLKTKHPTEQELAEREEKRKFYDCPHCGKAYQSTYKLRDHVQEKHSDDKPLVCTVCEKRFAVQHLFRLHLKTHEKRAKIPCEICGKEISSRYELNEHIKAVHMRLRPFKCQYCEKCFACRKTLKHHIYTHTGEKPYVCNVCGISYRQRSCLRNHKKTHESEQCREEDYRQKKTDENEQYTEVEYLQQSEPRMEEDPEFISI